MTKLVDIRNLTLRFRGKRTVHAINDVSLALEQGETLALLGESGSGKSVTALSTVQLLGETAQLEGSTPAIP